MLRISGMTVRVLNIGIKQGTIIRNFPVAPLKHSPVCTSPPIQFAEQHGL